MKLAVFTSTFPPYRGGMGNAAFCEAQALARLGHDITVFTPRYKMLKADPITTAALPFTIQRLEPILQSGNAAFCAGFITNPTGADLIYLHYPFFGCAEVLWLNKLFPPSCQSNQQKLILRYDMDVVGRGMKRVLFEFHTRFFMPSILRSADKVIFSSFDYAEHSNASWLLREAPGKCVEIPYGVGDKIFHPDQSVAKSARTILYVGGLDRAHYFKGFENLLHAFSLLTRDDKDVSLRVVGSGDMMPYYRNLCEQLGISRNTIFIGSCDNDQLRREYTGATVTVLPSTSRSESFGLVLLESMACGTPVIAHDIPGVRTLIHDGKNGCLVKPVSDHESGAKQRIEALRSCIELVLKDPMKAAQMGAYARNFAISQYGWDSVAKRLNWCFNT